MNKVYFDLNELKGDLPNPVITLGNFDGVHLGHQRIFEELRSEALACNGTPMVITFSPHPLKVLSPEKSPLLITTLEERIDRLQSCGNEVILCIPFTKKFASWSAERFIREVLVDKIGVKKILVGEDFRFGKDREGNVDFLRKAGAEYGFSIRKIDPVQIHGCGASSTRIRKCIKNGQLRESAAMLGRLYGVTGTVVHGDGRGKTIGFPTANIETTSELLPPNGVYAVWVSVAGTVKPGVANLGIKPTFAGKQFSFEVFIFDFDMDIYGKSMRTDFVEGIREERSFPNIQALVEQIQLDAEKAREILQEESPQAYQSLDTEKCRVLP